ncbi:MULTISPECIES: hypothetical protein [unclassified Streptomyces]|uniref:hypothetical protein n=1 Tax=unclassified Streptomyces TaxID=2593676 RepID=UPI0036EEB14D
MPEPREIAREASAAIRELNHATLNPASMPYAGEVSATVLALVELVDRLTQTLPQLQAGLRSVQQRDQIRLDHDGDVTAEVDAAVQGLEDACNALGAVHKGLSDASAPLFHMGAPYPPDDDED